MVSRSRPDRGPDDARPCCTRTAVARTYACSAVSQPLFVCKRDHKEARLSLRQRPRRARLARRPGGTRAIRAQQPRSLVGPLAPHMRCALHHAHRGTHRRLSRLGSTRRL
eukprot:2452535-Prymnesium_polylepis.1